MRHSLAYLDAQAEYGGFRILAEEAGDAITLEQQGQLAAAKYNWEIEKEKELLYHKRIDWIVRVIVIVLFASVFAWGLWCGRAWRVSPITSGDGPMTARLFRGSIPDSSANTVPSSTCSRIVKKKEPRRSG